MKPVIRVYRCRDGFASPRLKRVGEALTLLDSPGLRQAVEVGRERLELVLGEMLSEDAADARDVAPGRGLESLGSLVRELRVDDTGVRLAGGLRDQTSALEPVQQPRDPRGRQEDAVREIDAAQHPSVCT